MHDIIWTLCFSRARWCANLHEDKWTDIFPDPHQPRAYPAFDHLTDSETCERLKQQVVGRIPFNPDNYFFGEYEFGYLQDFTISNQFFNVCFDITPEKACLKNNEIYLSWRVAERYTYEKRKRQNDNAAWSLLTRANVLDTMCLSYQPIS